MIQVIPSLLVQTESDWLKQIRGLGNSVDQIQIDIADGRFVPSTTWADPAVIRDHLKLNCELHLMAADPLAEMKKWTNVPQVKRVLVHCEAIQSFDDIVLLAKQQGWKLGLVLNPGTPLAQLDPFLSDIQEVMFMGVNPGRQGQLFHPEVLDKIRAFKADHPNYFVAIDGAVNEQTLPDLVAAGVDIVCPGSAIFGNERTPRENVEIMREAINELERSM